MKSLPFVGERLAKKIIEILETGHLRRLDHMDPNIGVINLFNDVWGAGPKTAETWVAQVKLLIKYYSVVVSQVPCRHAAVSDCLGPLSHCSVFK